MKPGRDILPFKPERADFGARREEVRPQRADLRPRWPMEGEWVLDRQMEGLTCGN